MEWNAKNENKREEGRKGRRKDGREQKKEKGSEGKRKPLEGTEVGRKKDGSRDE